MMDERESKYHKIIAWNVRELRIKAKLSQEKLAEELGCSREFISRVENHKERLSLNSLLKLAQIFKINPSKLFAKIY